MIDFIKWIFSTIFNIVGWIIGTLWSVLVWVLSKLLNLAGSLLALLWDLFSVVFLRIVDVILRAYGNVIENYTGVALVAFPLAWMAYVKWREHNRRNGYTPDKLWKSPGLVIFGLTPIAIAVIGRLLPEQGIYASASLTFLQGLNNPLIGIAFVLFLFFAGYSILVNLGAVRPVETTSILPLMVHYSFAITLLVVVGGFSMAGYKVYAEQNVTGISR